MRRQVVISVASFLLLVSSLAGACVDGERAALLSFLDGLSPRPGDGIAASWRGLLDCCAWEGVGCDGGAVTRVSLPGRGLGGTISPSVANLTALAHLNLSGNSLAGAFPAELLSLPNAAVLDVSYNRLTGALPDLPAAAGRAPLPLQVLDVSSNYLSGQFPSMLWNLTPGLVSLNASNNSFLGAIPSSLCAICPALAVLDVSVNALSGTVSPGFGACSKLLVLSAGRNNLTGELPDDLFDVTTLQQLLLPSNRIQGRLDRLNIANLTNLVKLDLTYNALTGELPASIGALTVLEELRLGKNNLTGTIPPALSNWTSLTYLDLRSNSFVGDLGAYDFSGLVNLTVFDVAANNFSGTMPRTIYSCTSVTALRVANNEITGQVAPEIGNMVKLQFISLTINSFTNISGMFWNLRGCKDLTALLVSYNFYGEALPDAGWVGDHVSGVRLIVMEKCDLTGQIPSWISKLHSLNVLNLAGNRLTGPIPTWLGGMKKLYYVDLSDNHFAGAIPPSLTELLLLTSEKARAEFNPGHMPVVFTLTPNNGAAIRQGRAYYQMNGVAATLNLSDNDLSGEIPEEVGLMKTLQVLDLSHNNLSGGITPKFSGLVKLQILDLQWNHLTGSIPQALSKLHFLASFNVSHNDLEGPIPTGGQFNSFPPSSFAANPKLCGKEISVPCVRNSSTTSTGSSKTVSKRVLLAIVLGVCFGLVAVVIVLGLAVIAIRRIMSNGSVSDGEKFAEASLFDFSMSELNGDESKDTILFVSEEMANDCAARKSITFLDILKATNNFSPTRIIGSGGYGLVFLAELEGGTRLAVKKLNGDMCVVEREFRAEVEALSATRHENLVPLQGFCIRGRLRLLLYPYMANGSLHDWLHERPPDAAGRRPELDWSGRLRIARGASRGVQHIHERCTPQIVHRDIKSSNILLDESGEARVADFGLARLLLPDRTHVTTEVVGTLGYIPPEYGQGWVATLRGDVYSFGVVLLELLTGRRPVELVAAAHGQRRDLVGWVMQMRSAGKNAETLDPRLRRGKGEEAQMLYVLDLACLCVDGIPLSRPAIQEVVSWLDNVDTIGTS
ncbi:tyrosine-sulfated glycopeptide receptor 1-like [Lolium rigidum]|uniref:tyrosine-sulfated glycopeptide receptor 1-like n=1 Tax=Lolium rigidum TaxID=89674 RepID=UPI001F5D8423|nr:tyrosine-sulfated glycopeptide receptor 1-like [Lolium rigidum]